MGRDGVLNVTGMGISTAATFGVAIVLARAEGMASVGDYSTIFAARAILVLLCGVGMRIALTKYIAAARARQNYGQLGGILKLGLSVPAVLAVGMAILLAIFRTSIEERFFDGGTTGEPWLWLLAVSLPFGVLLDLTLAASRGFQDAAPAVRFGQITEPVGRLLLTVAAVSLGYGTTGAVAALTIASVVSALLAGRALRRQVRSFGATRKAVEARELFGFAGVSWLASLATQGLLWGDVLILSAMSTSEEVGVYQVSTRLVLLAMIAITPLTQSLAPRIAHYWEIQDLESLRQRYQNIVLWSWRITIGLFACLLIVPHDALRLFGSDLQSGVAVVYILACGAVFESFAAPSAVLLNQIGRNGLNMLINTSNLALNVALNVALIPILGIRGSALAWSLSLALPGVLRVWLVRRVAFPHKPINRLHVGAVIIAVIVAPTILVVVTSVTSLWWLRLTLAVPLVIGCYSIGVLRYAITVSEREALLRYRRVFVRELLTRVSWLRAWADRRRLRHLSPGARPLQIAELISPFRYDVWARHALYAYADANARARHDDFDAFVLGARQTLYGQWFDAILVPHLGLEAASEGMKRRTFKQSVTRGMYLLDSFDRAGFDSRFPITVTCLPAHTELEHRSLAEDRWLTVDGNHRLALLVRAGRTVLEPHEYRVETGVAPRNNTPTLTAATIYSELDLCAFYAHGLVAPEHWHRVRTWDDLLQFVSNPYNRPCLQRWPEHVRYSRNALQ